MNNETSDELMKRTREWLQSCVNAATRSGVPEEADLEAFLLAHIDGEPARLAAAREEQREACALDAEERVGCASTYDEIRSVFLDATPLADELERANEGVRYWTDLAQAEARDAAALRARVAELEADLKEADAGYRLAAERAEKAEAQVAAAHERLDEFGMRRDGGRATIVEGIAAMRERIDEYRIAWAKADAQVAALTSPVPGLAESGPYSLADVDAIEAHRGKPYARLRATVVERDALRAQVAAARAECARALRAPRCFDEYDFAADVLRAMDNATK